MYLKSDLTGEISIFGTYQIGWSPANVEDPPVSQADIDAYLLGVAQAKKIITLKQDLFSFEEVGHVYFGKIFKFDNAATNNMILKNQLLSYDSSNISVTGATKKYNLPANHGLTIVSGSKIEVVGFAKASNNGIKNVVGFANNEITVSETLMDEAVGAAVDISSLNRYKFCDIGNISVDFVDKLGISDCFQVLLWEKDRVMRKSNAYKVEINTAETVKAVEDIVIDFAE